MRVQRSTLCPRVGNHAERFPAMMTSGVTGGGLPSSTAAQRSQIHCAAGRVSGQWRRTWLVLAIVCGSVEASSRGSGMRHAGQRQQACCMGLSPVLVMVAPPP